MRSICSEKDDLIKRIQSHDHSAGFLEYLFWDVLFWHLAFPVFFEFPQTQMV